MRAYVRCRARVCVRAPFVGVGGRLVLQHQNNEHSKPVAGCAHGTAVTRRTQRKETTGRVLGLAVCAWWFTYAHTVCCIDAVQEMESPYGFR